MYTSSRGSSSWVNNGSAKAGCLSWLKKHYRDIVVTLVVVGLIGWNLHLSMTVTTRYKKYQHASQFGQAPVAAQAGEPVPGPSADIRHKRDTSRVSAGSDSLGGNVFIRWGRLKCPDDTKSVYVGVAGGSHITHAGGGSNYLCLPHDPIYGEFTATVNNHAIVYGSEYQPAAGAANNAPFSSQNARVLHDHNVPCAVCKTTQPVVLMIPGRSECYAGWRRLYDGYLMAGHHTNKGRTEHVCVDADPEADENGYRNEDGANFYQVEGACGSLPCPPYESGRELTCVVCAQ